ncbi:MAG: zf-TFIIB domain-containing protein [Dehalococcoidia bacterium]
MKCPRCGAELMVEQYKGIEVDLCPSCKGMWLDYGELEELEDTAFDVDKVKGSLMFRSFRGDLVCPKCQRPMEFFNYRAYNLELDFCDQGHGVWLDTGEEKRVLELMEKRGKDLHRKKKAEAEWSGFVKGLKSKSFVNKVKGLFK